MAKLMECIPNISEGRRMDLVEEFVGAGSGAQQGGNHQDTTENITYSFHILDSVR